MLFTLSPIDFIVYAITWITKSFTAVRSPVLTADNDLDKDCDKLSNVLSQDDLGETKENQREPKSWLSLRL
jgi:hypothetical protein